MGPDASKDDVVTTGAINYITAAVVALPVFLIYNPQPPAFGALWTGGGMGTLYFIAFFFVIYAIEKVGASSTTVVSVLSISMPIAFGAIFFDERPTLLQVVGIVLAMISLTLNHRFQTESPKKETARCRHARSQSRQRNRERKRKRNRRRITSCVASQRIDGGPRHERIACAQSAAK